METREIIFITLVALNIANYLYSRNNMKKILRKYNVDFSHRDEFTNYARINAYSKKINNTEIKSEFVKAKRHYLVSLLMFFIVPILAMPFTI